MPLVRMLMHNVTHTCTKLSELLSHKGDDSIFSWQYFLQHTIGAIQYFFPLLVVEKDSCFGVYLAIVHGIVSEGVPVL